MNKIDELYLRMMEHDAGSPARIHHFVKVHSFARMIAIAEKLPPNERYTIEAAALVHDIGVKATLDQSGAAEDSCPAKTGMTEAKQLMKSLQFDPTVIDRVVYLVGCHHIYTNVDGTDHRILVEAELLVNLYESGASRESVLEAYRKHFHTEAGRELCRTMFAPEASVHE